MAPRSLSLVPGSPPVTVDPNGIFQVGQMYVHYVRLAEPRARFPLLLWHGGGMTGAAWETKPDGRPGWQRFFLAAGHDVYVSDAVERGRAGWARYPEIYPGEPFFRSAREAWLLFRIGPADGYAPDPNACTPFAGQRFPVAALDTLAQSFVPRWNGNEARALAAYIHYLERIGPAVVIAHSQGGSLALQAALARPHLLRGLVLLEPGGAPDPNVTSLAPLTDIPILVIWGDHLSQVPFWHAAFNLVRTACQTIETAGGDVEWLDLPAAGIPGNSHLLMLDDNSDDIADRVQAWMARKGLMNDGSASGRH